MVYNSGMARFTVNLPDERHKQLKMRAAMSGKSIGEVLEDALCESERHALAEARRLTNEARDTASKAQPQLSDDELMDLAVAETRAVRKELAEEREAARRR